MKIILYYIVLRSKEVNDEVVLQLFLPVFTTLRSVYFPQKYAIGIIEKHLHLKGEISFAKSLLPVGFISLRSHAFKVLFLIFKKCC